MAGKITELGAQTGAQIALTDLTEMVDVSDTSMAATGTNKKVPQAEYIAFLNANGVGSGIAMSPNPPSTTTVLWADTDEVGGVITIEDAVDAVAAALAAGTHANVIITYDDAANSISLSAAGGETAVQTIESVAGPTYTVMAADANKIKRLVVTTTVTLPSGGLGVGARVDFLCIGGPATFVLGSGASWDVRPTPSAVARSVGSFVTAIKMGTTSWALTGDLV